MWLKHFLLLVAFCGAAIAENTVAGVKVVMIPSFPLLSGSLELRCMVTASQTTDGLSYTWEKEGTAIPNSQNKKSITLTAAAENNGKKYKCIVTKGQNSHKSEEITVTLHENIEKMKPTVKARETCYTNKPCTLVCELDSSLEGDSFEWFKGATQDVSKTKQTWTINAGSAAVEYKCKVKHGDNHSMESAVLSIKGQDPVVEKNTCTESDLDTKCSNFTKFSGNCIAGHCECITDFVQKGIDCFPRSPAQSTWGKPCKEGPDGVTSEDCDGKVYTRKCFNKRCECATDTQLTKDKCIFNGAGLVAASLLTSFLGLVLTQIPR